MLPQNQASYKIYSRKRFCKSLGGNNPKKKKIRQKIKKITPFLILMVVSFITCYLVWTSIDPVFETLCKTEAKGIATIITNEQSTKVMEAHTYDEFFSIQKNEDGKIQMISANILTINSITSDIAIKIQQELDNASKRQVDIAMGSATGIKMLSGFGPRVNIKISTAGSVDTNLKSEFIAQSINQTLHRVYLEVECKVNILTPFSTIQDSIFNQVVLAENVILGEIPSTYYNFDGLESETDLMEAME